MIKIWRDCRQQEADVLCLRRLMSGRNGMMPEKLKIPIIAIFNNCVRRSAKSARPAKLSSGSA